MRCQICDYNCLISEGEVGKCHMNTFDGGCIKERFPDRYLALWPGAVETIPFLHYTPGGRYLLLSTIGCNLSCQGCVSHILAKTPDLIQSALQYASPDEIVTKVKENSCLGVIFCLNEPSVSLGTLVRVADKIKKAGYSIGCASNGCMSSKTAAILSKNIDFINIGMKGSTDAAYQECVSPCSVKQVFSNIELFYNEGVHLEVSVVYQRGKEEEVLGVADTLSHVSPDIPLHLMRFVPFEGVSEEYEPTLREGESLLQSCIRYLRWVYLFNTPGTQYLSTWCSECGNLLIERGFNGPMGAKLSLTHLNTTCSCGVSVPITGQIYRTYYPEARFKGGYRTSVVLDLIYGTFRMMGVTDTRKISQSLICALNEGNLEEFQVLFSTPEGYIQYLKLLSSWSNTPAFDPLLSYLEKRVGELQEFTKILNKPRVFCALSHPLLPMYPDKMENAIVSLAGGEVLNYHLDYDEKNPKPFTREAFQVMEPDIIIISGPGGQTVDTFLDYCKKEALTAPACEKSAIYQIPKDYLKTGPFWLLATLWVSNKVHPSSCSYDLSAEELHLRSLLPGLEIHNNA